jgi:CheY-like chemotaxis protein/HPt (histidine-containing phosphotransfer) domain-containing protein/two-component sensor histidine kinase
VRTIVADLRAIGRMDSPDQSQCDAAEVIRIASRMALSDLRHRARLELDLAPVGPLAIAPARLTQVLLNLLTNAMRSFAKAEGAANLIRVTLAPGAPGPDGAATAHLAVSDNGRGIAPEDLERVFDPFFTRSGADGGTGLGLSISRRLMHEAGGSIRLDSQRGRGTTAHLTLPCAPVAVPAPAPARPAPPPAPSAGPARLMVVDDDANVARLIAQGLCPPHEVELFTDPRAALDRLAGGGPRIDLVLCDLMMPEIPGADLHRAATALPGGAPPFLFITGGAVTEASMAHEARMAAEGRLVRKPFGLTELRAAVARLLPAGAAPPPAPQPAGDSGVAALLGPEGYARQVHALCADVDHGVDRMQAALACGDLAGLGALAHRLKGAAAILGFAPLAAGLAAIELAAAATPADAARLAPLIRALDAPRAQLAQPGPP